jgi:hypothetical protein
LGPPSGPPVLARPHTSPHGAMPREVREADATYNDALASMRHRERACRAKDDYAGAGGVRRQMEQLRATHGELQHARLARALEADAAAATAAAARRVAKAAEDCGAKVAEVKEANEAARARLAARHEREARALEADLASQMATLRPGPATAEARKLRAQHQAATHNLRRSLRVATELAPGAGIDVSGLDAETADTSGAVRTLLERSATLLQEQNTASTPSREPTATTCASSSSPRGRGISGSRLRVSSGGILPAVMHAVTGVADAQELKAELSGMIRAETAGRLERSRQLAGRAADKYRGELALKQRIQTEAMRRRCRAELKAAERAAAAEVDTARVEGARSLAAVRHGFGVAAKDLQAAHTNAADVRASKQRAARESLLPFDPTARG